MQFTHPKVFHDKGPESWLGVSRDTGTPLFAASPADTFGEPNASPALPRFWIADLDLPGL